MLLHRGDQYGPQNPVRSDAKQDTYQDVAEEFFYNERKDTLTELCIIYIEWGIVIGVVSCKHI